LVRTTSAAEFLKKIIVEFNNIRCTSRRNVPRIRGMVLASADVPDISISWRVVGRTALKDHFTII